MLQLTTDVMKALLTNWAKVGGIINRQMGELTIIATFWHGAELLLFFLLFGSGKGQVVAAIPNT
jgi:hypothetical protein